MSLAGKKIKCPNCEKEGGVELSEGRYYFQCYGLCQMRTHLKLLNNKHKK